MNGVRGLRAHDERGERLRAVLDHVLQAAGEGVHEGLAAGNAALSLALRGEVATRALTISDDVMQLVAISPSVGRVAGTCVAAEASASTRNLSAR